MYTTYSKDERIVYMYYPWCSRKSLKKNCVKPCTFRSSVNQGPWINLKLHCSYDHGFLSSALYSLHILIPQVICLQIKSCLPKRKKTKQFFLFLQITVQIQTLIHACTLTLIWTSHGHMLYASTNMNIFKRRSQHISRLMKPLQTPYYQGPRLPLEQYDVTKSLVLYINDIHEKCDDIINMINGCRSKKNSTDSNPFYSLTWLLQCCVIVDELWIS
jgi:hypothetical protein